MAIDPRKIVNDLMKVIGSDYRSKLNENIHIADISYGALLVSDTALPYEDYLLILEALKQEYPVRNDLKSVISIIKDSSTKFGFSALVEDPKYGTFVVAQSYNSLQTKISKVLKNLDVKSSFTGSDSLGRTNTNIGHIPTNEVNSAKSPLSEKIGRLASRLPLSASAPILEELNTLYNTHSEEVSYTFNRENFDNKGFNKILGTSTVLVTLHSATRNSQFAAEETAIISRVIKYLNSSEFIDQLLVTPGSNTILEDISLGIKATIEGKTFSSEHSKKSPTATSRTVKGNGKLVVDKPKVLRNKQGQFYSLANLLVLLNTHLQDVVSANMGSGSQKNILNYRTGRFAASAAVQRLTQSKEGAITAFYTYMKYPYQTFESGYAQGRPESRDPKLLIAKSIREIAATKVANRMRAVLS